MPSAPLPMLRNSERHDFKRCPQRWWWSWRDGYKLDGPPADALWFGIGMHEVLAHWYCGPGQKRGANPLKVWRDYCDGEVRTLRVAYGEHEKWDEQRFVDAKALGEDMLANYFDTYGKDPAWNVIAPEHTFQVRIPHPLKPGKFIVTLAGTFDLVFRDEDDEDKLKLGEHKNFKVASLNHLSLDDQAGTYWAVATTIARQQGLIGKNERLHAIVYNILRKGMRDDRPINADGLRTNKPTKDHYLAQLPPDVVASLPKVTAASLQEAAKFHGITVLGEPSANQPTPLLVRKEILRTAGERRTQIARVQSEALVMEQFRDGTLPLYKNPTRDCSWDCSFFDLCEMQEQGNNRDLDDFIREVYHRADPYADHRKSAAEGGD